MMDVDAPKPRPGLPDWYLQPRKTAAVRNPGRRGLVAESYRFPLRMPFEAAFRDSQEYRILRYAFDAAERKLAILQAMGAPSGRLKTAAARLNAASGKCAEFMLRNLPETVPTGPTVLTRELEADGTLVSETEVPAVQEKP